MNDNNTKRKVIGVYGSANSAENSPDWQDGYRVGQLIAQAGHAVLTGGYGGMMGAASQGGADAGGHVIGVTVGLFRERGLLPNPYLHEEIHLPTLAERLNYVITTPDAYVIMRGGVGTLAELGIIWSLSQVAELPMRPIVLVGTQWTAFAKHFMEFSTITPNDLRRLTLVDSPDEVVAAIEVWWANPPHIPIRVGDVSKTPMLGDSSDPLNKG